MEISTANMTHEEWLATRKNYIGGSDAAAILGMNPYKTPLAVYADKLDLVDTTEDNERMRQGRDLEEYVAQRFTEETGLAVEKLDYMVVSEEYPFMSANVDRVVVGEYFGLECKTTSLMNKTDFDSGDIPPVYYWQCQHYMTVTGASKWYLAVLVLSKSFHAFCIERNEAHIKLLIEAESNFWNNHILKQKPPLPTGSEIDDETISDMYPTTNGEQADLTVYGSDLDYLKILEDNGKCIKSKVDEIKQRLKLAIGECEGGQSNRFKVTYKTQSRRGIDVERMQIEAPEIFIKYLKTSTNRVLRIKEIKE